MGEAKDLEVSPVVDGGGGRLQAVLDYCGSPKFVRWIDRKVIDLFIEVGDRGIVAEKLGVGIDKVGKILGNPWNRWYVKKRMEDVGSLNGMTFEGFMKELKDVEDGKVKMDKVQLYAKKLRGDALGYFREKSGYGVPTNAIQINITQADGKS